MNIRTLCASIALTALASFAVSASETLSKSRPSDASIPFANHGGIHNWQADRDRGLWVQDIRRNWYYAKFMGPCFGLDFANAIGFDTRPMGSFDRFSAIVVPREGRCVVQSFTRSAGPPLKKGHNAKAAEEARKSEG